MPNDPKTCEHLRVLRTTSQRHVMCKDCGELVLVVSLLVPLSSSPFTLPTRPLSPEHDQDLSDV